MLMNCKRAKKLIEQLNKIHILDYGIWGALENNTYTIPHPNIGLLKTDIEHKWKEIPEEFIRKSFRMRVYTITEIIHGRIE